jgi:DNA-binding NarL/FixJ family response regulator
VRVVIAEDSGLLRHLLTDALAGRGCTVTGQAGDPDELLGLVDTEPPDAVVLDIRMPPTYRDEGIRAAEQVRARHPGVAVLVLSHYAETAYAVRLLECSSRAIGYLVKDRVQDPDRLVEALRRVVAGEVVIDPDVVSRVLLRRRVTDPLRHLTTGERQVLAMMAEGRSNAAIAGTLNYSVKTVEKRVTAISEKLGLRGMGDPGRDGVNVRVLAVVTYLRSAGNSGAGNSGAGNGGF